MIGHVKTRKALERELPPVTLLKGQPSVGKLTLARHLAAHHQIEPVDLYEHADVALTIDSVRNAVRFIMRAPFGKAGKLVIIRLDKASPAALHGLLKNLEEPPPTARFILLSSGRTLPTIESRSRIFHLGLLSDEELKTILTQHGISPVAAEKLVANGDGTVKGALTAPDDRSRVRALMVLRGLAIRDGELFDRGFKDFDEAARDWLVRWLSEAMTKQFRAFTEQEMYGLHDSTLFCTELAVALARNRGGRARLAVRAALQPLLRL